MSNILDDTKHIQTKIDIILKSIEIIQARITLELMTNVKSSKENLLKEKENLQEMKDKYPEYFI